MKLFFYNFVAIIAISTILLFSGCAKEGPAGPAGTNGINGTNGIAGTNGNAGTNGTNGNANVIGTNPLTLNASNWTLLSGSFYSTTLTAPAITQSILDRGLVYGYIQYGTEWYALPDIGFNNQTIFGFGLGTISLLNFNSDGSLPLNPGTMTVRFVIVSPSNKLANPNIDWKNWNQVKQVLSIQE